jgi:hypothetical protein
MAVVGSPRSQGVDAAIDEQGYRPLWQTFSTGFRGEFVCGLCACIGRDDLPEQLRRGAAAAAPRHVQPLRAAIAIFGRLGNALVQ